MFTEAILFSKMAALIQIFKKILNIYFSSIYQYILHKNIVTQRLFKKYAVKTHVWP